MSSRFKDLDIELPASLSDAEKETFKARFEAIKKMLDDTCEAILGMDRETATRFYKLIVQGLQEADAKFIGGAKAVEDTKKKEELNDVKPESDLKPGRPLPPGAEVIRENEDGSRDIRMPVRRDFGEFSSKNIEGDTQFVIIKQGPIVTATEPPNFNAIFHRLTEEAQEKARNLLECVQEFYREGGPGADIICRDCNIEQLQKCLRIQDPSIDDILTHMIRAESEGR